MGSPLFCTPNFIKSTYFVPKLGGGDWDVDNGLVNLQDKYFINKAISTDLALTSTRFDVDFGVVRDIKAFIIPDSNVSSGGLIRFRASGTPAWDDVLVRGVNNLAATTLNIKSTTSAATITAGEIFTITGDSTIYEVVVGTTLAPSTNGSITIKRTKNTGTGLALATIGNEIIICNSGDFVNDIKADTGWVQYDRIIYGLVDPWGSPTIWLGTETQENRATLGLPNPFIYINPSIALGRYTRTEIDNATNPDGFVSLTDCHITSGFIPSTGIGLGAVLGIKSNSSSEESAGGVEAFDEEKSGRYLDMEVPGLSVDEAMTSVFDMQRKLDISKDFFFIFDQDDTILMNRRSFVARFEEIGGQNFVDFDWVDSRMRIKEKLA